MNSISEGNYRCLVSYRDCVRRYIYSYLNFNTVYTENRIYGATGWSWLRVKLKNDPAGDDHRSMRANHYVVLTIVCLLTISAIEFMSAPNTLPIFDTSGVQTFGYEIWHASQLSCEWTSLPIPILSVNYFSQSR